MAPINTEHQEAQLRAETLLEAAERLRDERMKVLGPLGRTHDETSRGICG